MSFRINNWKKIVSRVFWAIILILLAGFFLRVWTWERQYYGEKEGSFRDVAVILEPEQELIEIKPTEVEIAEYFVDPDKPRYLSIEKLGIGRSRIFALGVTTSNALAAPNNIFDVGWYDKSGKPGEGGTMLLDGHSGGPHEYGIFKNLSNLTEGDIIVIERGDGVVFRYEVKESQSIKLDEANDYMQQALMSPVPGKESLTIISCTGEWSNVQRTFLSRQFVRAILVD